MRQALLPALLDFERMPGRYPLVLREPRLLFDQARAILLLAVGRAVDGLPDMTSAQEEEARRGARFFVRTALLRSGVDHYTLLGLVPGADTEQVRDHYRLMIRLTHPDFQASGESWPADAASRINIANDVLSSAERRADYQAALEAAAKPAAVAPGKPVVPTTHVPPRPQAVARRLSLQPVPLVERWRGLVSTRVKWAVTSVGALLSGGALVMLSPTDNGSLTARKPATVSDDTAAYIEAGASVPPAVAASTPVAVAGKKAPVAAPQAAARTLAAAPTTATPRPRVTPETIKTASAQTARQVTAVAGPLSLTMDTRLAAPPLAEPVATEPAATADAPQRLTMQQVHPALTNVVGSLYAGRGESLVQWVDSDWRHLPANQAFVTQFNQWLSGQRVTQLGKVSFKSRAQGDALVVDGLVEVHLQDAGNQVQVRDLQLRAYFQPQDGRPVLTQLAASQAR